MKRLTPSIAVLLALAAVSIAGAQTPPGTKIRERAQEARERAQEGRQDAQEGRQDAQERREDRKEEAKENRDEHKERRDLRRETRKERREARREEIKKRWGDLALRTDARAELQLHARRMARLYRIRALAEEAGKTDVVERANKLIAREQARHERAMEAIRAKGGKP
jgi:hypothetical protein